MTVKISLAADTAMLAALIADIGASPILRLFDGAIPANCDAADIGSVLVQAALPASPFAAVAGRTVAKAGTWSGVGAAAAGAGTDATVFRIYNSSLECKYQGTAGETAEDMILDNSNIAEAQAVNVSVFTITQDNS
jgi:hypothetical protein